MTTRKSRNEEVSWGVSQERGVLDLWCGVSPYADGASRKLKGGEFDDYDYILFTKDGLPLCYVEIKVRRKPFVTFGDVIVPYRKHQYANRLANYNIAFLLATYYPCGTIAEVHLGDTPTETVYITRGDRASTGPVKHARYEGESVNLYQVKGKENKQ